MRIGVINGEQQPQHGMVGKRLGGRVSGKNQYTRNWYDSSVDEKRMEDPDFAHIVKQFKEGGAPLKPYEKALAKMAWERGRHRSQLGPRLSEERSLE